MLTVFETEDRGPSESKRRIANWIELAQDGDRDAFGRLVEELGEDLLRIAKRTVYTNRIDPQDVFQDSILQAMYSIADLRTATRSGFLSWFSGIARNRVLTLRAGATRRGTPNKKTPYPWLRMEQYTPEQIDLEAPVASESLAEDGHCPLDPILSELSPVTRVGWLMREVFGVDWGSVAVVLRKGSQAAARQTHYRALQNFHPSGLLETNVVACDPEPFACDR